MKKLDISVGTLLMKLSLNFSNYVHKELTNKNLLVELFTLRQVLFDLRAGNSNLAKSLGEKSNHAMYQDENPHRCLLSLQN